MQPAENPPSACAGSWVWRSGRAQPRHAAAEPLAPASKTNTARGAAPRRPGCPRAWPQPQAFSSCRTFHDKEGFQERSLGAPGGGEQEPGSGGRLRHGEGGMWLVRGTWACAIASQPSVPSAWGLSRGAKQQHAGGTAQLSPAQGSRGCVTLAIARGIASHPPNKTLTHRW